MKTHSVSKSSREGLMYEDIASLGSWVLPSGTVVEARLLRAGVGQDALDLEVKKGTPRGADDLNVFADFVKPEAQQRAQEFRTNLDHARMQTASANRRPAE